MIEKLVTDWVTFYFILQVKDVRLLEAKPNEEKKFQPSPNEESFKNALEADHLIFTERRGRFVVVSPVKTEPAYITNIKRGILSALQLQFTNEPLKILPEVRFFQFFFFVCFVYFFFLISNLK